MAFSGMKMQITGINNTLNGYFVTV